MCFTLTILATLCGLSLTHGLFFAIGASLGRDRVLREILRRFPEGESKP